MPTLRQTSTFLVSFDEKMSDHWKIRNCRQREWCLFPPTREARTMSVVQQHTPTHALCHLGVLPSKYVWSCSLYWSAQYFVCLKFFLYKHKKGLNWNHIWMSSYLCLIRGLGWVTTFYVYLLTNFEGCSSSVKNSKLVYMNQYAKFSQHMLLRKETSCGTIHIVQTCLCTEYTHTCATE